MPSPFNNPEQPVVHTTGALVETVEVTDSELYCQYCGGMTDCGLYVPGNKRLSWDCVDCGQPNVVRGMDID